MLYRLQRTVRAGRVPSAEIVDGALVLLAGALMITPGFLSDALAIVLLLPPTRAVVRRLVLRRIRDRGGFFNLVTSTPVGPQPPAATRSGTSRAGKTHRSDRASAR